MDLNTVTARILQSTQNACGRMNCVWIKVSLFLHMLTLVLLSLFCGCEKKSETAKSDTDIKLDIPAIKLRYANSSAYSDSARVVFSYTLNGVPFQESHPLSCTFDNASSNQQINWFRFQLNSSKHGTVGRILDVETQNFDGQVAVSDEDFSGYLANVNTDPIAVHYLTGRDDVPWIFATDNADQMIKMLGVAYTNVFQQSSAWFSKANLMEEKAVRVDEKDYIDAKFQSPYGMVWCRIDPIAELILGVQLPKEMLSAEISSSPAIKNVTLSLLFENARFELPPSSATTLAASVANSEKPVSQFVVLPEQFPSEAIGKKIENWQLGDHDQKHFKAKSATGAISLFFYGDPKVMDPKEIAAINSMAQAKQSVNLAWVTPATLPLDQVQNPFVRMGFFCDQQNDLLKFFKPNSATFLFVTNKIGEIQYYSKLSNKWLINSDGVIQRIRAGENVAVEMHDQYAKYFLKYQRSLANFRANESTISALQQQ